MDKEGYNHDSVGAWDCQYKCSLPSESGCSKNIRTFELKAGDDPNFKLAKWMMPGAEIIGQIAWAQNCFDDSERDRSLKFHTCAIKVGGSVFKSMICAKNKRELNIICRDIGGMRPIEEPPLPFLTKLGLIIKYLWLRRPQIKFRSPVDFS